MGVTDPEPVEGKVSEEHMRYLISEIPKKPLMNLYQNVIFQTFFDFCLVDVLPRSAYYPWKKNIYKPFRRSKKSLTNAEKINEANQDNLMLLYVRPRKPEDVNVGNPKHFSYFLFTILKNKVSALV